LQSQQRLLLLFIYLFYPLDCSYGSSYGLGMCTG